jgi:isopenicillin N synthase-like dioxygenase
VPLVDLSARHGSPAERAEVAAQVDAALHEVGFLLVTGHGVAERVLADARRDAHAFFDLPLTEKLGLSIGDDAYRGYVASGVETNAAAYGLEGAPDLKETYVFGPFDRPDDAYHRDGARWYSPNRQVAAVPTMDASWRALFTAFDALAMDLLGLAEVAMEVPAGTFTDECHRGMSTLISNWYPAGKGLVVEKDQYRVGPHTDYGGLTLLDREPGRGGLQVQTLDDEWIDAPYVEGALTVNVGDMLSHWTAGRWRSTRHQVLPPPLDVPEEELLSLVFFHDPDHDAVVTPLGHPEVEPVLAGDYLAAKLAALTGTTTA